MPSRIERFPHRLAGHCSSGAFRDLLQHRGLRWGDAPLSEPMVFGLAAGLGLAFTRLPEALSPAGYYLGGRSLSFEDDLASTLGLGIRRVAVSDPDEAWVQVRRRLDAGEPTLVFADCAELDYLRAKTHMSLHSIVLVGYDEASRVAFVADNDRETIQRCSFESLRRARNSFHFPAPTNHMYLEIDFPARLPPLADATRKAIELEVRQIRSPDNPLIDVFGAGFAGLAALDGFREYAAAEPAAVSRPLALYVEKAGTGGSFFRRLYASFLAEVAKTTGDRGLDPAAAAYDDLAKRWSALVRARVEDVPAQVAAVAEAEKRAAGDLEQWLRS